MSLLHNMTLVNCLLCALSSCSESPKKKENDVTFHIDIIEKIDSIIKAAEQEKIPNNQETNQKSLHVEPRSPLKKEINPSQVIFDIPQKNNINILPIPEEFSNIIDQPSTKEFRYISSLDEILASSDPISTHVEIINLPRLLQRTIPQTHQPLTETLTTKHTPQTPSKKVEIIDLHLLKKPQTPTIIPHPTLSGVHASPHPLSFLKNLELNEILKPTQPPISTKTTIKEPQGTQGAIRIRVGKHSTTSDSSEQQTSHQKSKDSAQQYYLRSVSTKNQPDDKELQKLQKELESAKKQLEQKKQYLKEEEQKAHEEEIQAKKEVAEKLKLQKQFEKEQQLKEKQKHQEQLKKQKEKEKLERQKTLQHKKLELQKQKEQCLLEKQAKKELAEKLKLQKQFEKEQQLKEKQKHQEQLKKQKEKEKLELQKQKEQCLLEKQAKKLKQQEITEQKEQIISKSKSLPRVRLRKTPPKPPIEKHQQSTTEPLEDNPPQPQPEPHLVAKVKTSKSSETNVVTEIDKELEEVLKILDKLLAELPEKVIQDFAQSKEFVLYEKIMSRYKK